MKNFLFAILFFSAYNVAAQEVNPNGYNKFYYPDGSLSSEGTLRNGQPDGFWKTYYPDGVLKSAGRRTDFQLDSVWLFFDQKGDTINVINYNYGKKNGYTLTYENNLVKSKELYRDDKKQGVSFYYEKGILHEEIPFKDDKKQGEGYRYNKNEEIVAIMTFKNGSLIDQSNINRTDSRGLKQGVFKTFYPDKKVKTECYYKDDKLNGYYREFDQKGKEISIVRYINGEIQEEKKNSLTTAKETVKVKNEFYSDGTLKKSGGYKDSLPVGVHRTYNEQGKIKSSETYSEEGKKIADGIVDGKGREQGKWTLYDSSGSVSGKGSYKNGKREGEWQFYFPGGQVEQKGVYKDGNPEGKWLWYYSDGKLRREENFLHGKEDGICYELSISGDTIQSGEFSEGEKYGLWKTDSGDALVVENFSDGELHGDYKVYFMPAQKPKIEAKYLQGNLHGKYREFYENGRVKSEGQYAGGKENGVWRYYGEDGLLETEIEYSQGEIAKVDGNAMPKK
jgi:antitoxin component YwqK of YwqJK toxin-antitoxin module